VIPTEDRSGRVFLVGNGPSLTAEDLTLIQNIKRPWDVCFGSNYIHKLYTETPWRPDFWVTVETPSFFDTLLHLQQGYRCYLTANRAQKVELRRSSFRDRENLSYLPVCDHLWQMKKEGKHPPTEFHEPICLYGGSGTTSAQLAIKGGWKEIYLIGHDCLYVEPEWAIRDGVKRVTKDFSHFDEDYDFDAPVFPPEIRTATLLDAWRLVAEYANLAGARIVNCTRGGVLEEFQRKDLEELCVHS
jgi:hypothetical protein